MPERAETGRRPRPRSSRLLALAGPSDTLSLDGGLGKIADLDVRVNVGHNWVGDLTATLEHVDTGTAANL